MSLSVSELRKAYSYRHIKVRNYALKSIFLSFVLSFVFAFYFPSENPILKCLIFSAIFIISFYFTLTYPYLIYSQHRFIISSYGYLALSDLCIILRFSSLFDACYHIYLSRYPVISDLFKDIVIHGIKGENIGESLNRMANSQPSVSFKDGVQAVLLNFHKDDDELIHTYEDAISTYKSLTSQIETKFSILMGLCFFAPIISVIFSSLYLHDIFQVIALTCFQIFLLSLIFIVLTRSLIKHKMV